MDWERTKTILLVAFFLLNCGFAYVLWIHPLVDSEMYISMQQIEQVTAELQTKNIHMAVEIPRRLYKKRFLSVRNGGPYGRKEAMALLGERAAQLPGFTEYQKFIADTGEVEIFKDGRLHYTSRLNAARSELTQAQAWAQAEAFLVQTIGLPPDAVRGRAVQLDNGVWLMEFCQQWHKYRPDISRITVHVAENGVLEMDWYWVEILGFEGEKMVTVPATGALLVVSDILPPDSGITGIYMSWYSHPATAERWRAHPVWVVESNTARFYVNAFTGELEGSSALGRKSPLHVE